MKNRISYSPEALADLNDIWNYVVSELYNLDAADQTVGRIMNAGDNLGTFSEMGHHCRRLLKLKMLIDFWYVELFAKINNNRILVDNRGGKK